MSEPSHVERPAGLTCRVWPAISQPAAGLAILLHGFGQDESAMAVFRPALPGPLMVISPRALSVVVPGGNSWRTQPAGGTRPLLEDFDESNAHMAALLEASRAQGHLAHPLPIVGFSQGAAAALACHHRPTLGRLALLAGSVPHPSRPPRVDQPLSGLPTFVAHGTRDATVPPEKPNEAIDLLRTAGTSLTTCEAPIGHEVTPQCVRALRDWASWAVGVAAKLRVLRREV
jgi:predicted esterase